MSDDRTRQPTTASADRPTLPETGEEWSSWTLPALLVMASGLALMVIVYIAGRDEGPRSVLEPLAFGAPTLVAGLLALFGILRGKGALVIAAGVALFPLSWVSIVLWPLFVPAVFLVGYGARRLRGVSLRELAAAVLVAAGLPVALFSMLIHQDPRTWVSDDGKSGGGSSNVVTNVEAGLSLAITATVAGVATVAIRRRD